MSDIDKRLEELVARTTEFCGCDTNEDVALCVHDTEAAGELERRAPALAAALLRARKALHIYAGMSVGPGNSRAHAALADTELEKLPR